MGDPREGPGTWQLQVLQVVLAVRTNTVFKETPARSQGQPRRLRARLQVAALDLTHPQAPEEQVETRVLLPQS